MSDRYSHIANLDRDEQIVETAIFGTLKFVCCYCALTQVSMYEYFCGVYCECMALIEEAELS